MSVSTHALVRCNERLGHVLGGLRTRALRKKIVRDGSRGVRLTMQEVRKLGLWFYRGREYRRIGNTIYVLAGTVVVTVITLGGIATSAFMFF